MGRVALEIPKMHMKGVIHKGMKGKASGQVGLHGGAPSWPATPLVGPPKGVPILPYHPLDLLSKAQKSGFSKSNHKVILLYTKPFFRDR
jgi:hypothetical protein